MDSSGATANMKSTQVKEGSMHSMTLSRLLLPTPRTSDMNSPGIHGNGGQDLRTTIAMGLLPTPTTSMGGANNNSDAVTQRGHGINLKGAIQGLLPTPDCSDRRSMNSKQQGLSNVVKGLLPTLAAADGFKTTSNSSQANLNMLSPVGSNSQLNPLFVGEMMGFSPDWTLLPFQKQAGADSQSKPMVTP